MRRSQKANSRRRSGRSSVTDRGGRTRALPRASGLGTAAGNPLAPEFVIEEHRRLSDSMLWSLQRSFFDERGADAWHNGGVPQFVTTNSFIARAYARVVCGFLRDCATSAGAAGSADEPSSAYIVELGAGSGRFAFHFLTALRPILARARSDLGFTYVMTDFTERNLAAWRAHPSLQPLLDAGLLDFAVFDAAHPMPLRLERSGVVLGPHAVPNPTVVVANYVLDSIPQDLFSVEDGQLYENRVTLTSPQHDPDPVDPDLLRRVQVRYEPVAAERPRYGDAGIERVLDHYVDVLPSATFLMPVAGLGCVRYFHELAGGPLLMLVGDRGYEGEEGLLDQDGFGMAVHGSFSLPVNYDALGRYVSERGGLVLRASGHRASLKVAGFVFGLDDGDGGETAQAFTTWVDEVGPDDFFQLKKALEPVFDNLTLDQVLAFLRLSNWDASLLAQTFPAFYERVESAGEAAYPDISSALREVWEHYYPSSGDVDVAFCIASLFHGMGDHVEALRFLDYSLRFFGPDPATIYLKGLCHWQQRNLEPALATMEEVLAMDHSFEPARHLRIRIRAALGGRPEVS